MIWSFADWTKLDWLIIAKPTDETIATECCQQQNKFTTEFESTWTIILKQLFVDGEVNNVE